MKHRLNLDIKDSNYTLLKEIFKIMDSRKTFEILTSFGFKNLNKLVKGKVNKEIKKGFRDLENVLNNTARNSDGNINFASGVDDENSMFKGYKFDF